MRLCVYVEEECGLTRYAQVELDYPVARDSTENLKQGIIVKRRANVDRWIVMKILRPRTPLYM